MKMRIYVMHVYYLFNPLWFSEGLWVILYIHVCWQSIPTHTVCV